MRASRSIYDHSASASTLWRSSTDIRIDDNPPVGTGPPQRELFHVKHRGTASMKVPAALNASTDGRIHVRTPGRGCPTRRPKLPVARARRPVHNTNMSITRRRRDELPTGPARSPGGITRASFPNHTGPSSRLMMKARRRSTARTSRGVFHVKLPNHRTAVELYQRATGSRHISDMSNARGRRDKLPIGAAPSPRTSPVRRPPKPRGKSSRPTMRARRRSTA